MLPLILKWAIYVYGDGDCLLRPHFTGNFSIVDCTEYLTKKDVKAQWYSKETEKEFLKWYYIEYNGEKYYECEFSPYGTGNMELLSDLSDVDFYDEATEFN